MPDERFAADVWRPSLERYGRVTHLTVAVYDADGMIACGPFNPTPLFDTLAASKHDPGLFMECVQRCLGTEKREPFVVLTRFGLAVVGAPLVVVDEVVAAAVAGYHLSQFPQIGALERLAHESKLSSQHLWDLAREKAPMSPNRLADQGELLHLMTDTVLREHDRTRQHSAALEALRASLAERDALLKEVHHRVKNNLQVITSLLEMHARQAAGPQALSALFEARNRVSAIATIHELLYESGSFSRVDLVSYARRLISHVVSLYQPVAPIRVSVDGGGITVDLARAVPIGLLLNELVSNVCKHAFSSKTEGELSIVLQQDDGQIHLRVTDTGVGLPKGFNDQTSATLGVQLVRMFAKQLGGKVAFTSGDGGTSVDFHLPIDPNTS